MTGHRWNLCFCGRWTEILVQSEWNSVKQLICVLLSEAYECEVKASVVLTENADIPNIHKIIFYKTYKKKQSK